MSEDRTAEALAAARDLLADGAERSDVVAALMSQFDCGRATAYRWAASALVGMPPTDATIMVAQRVLESLETQLTAAEAAGDTEQVLAVTAAMVAAASKLKVAQIVR